MNTGAVGYDHGIDLTRLRGMLLAVFVLGSVGTEIELLLLGHYEEIWQLIPLGLLTVSLTVIVAWVITGGRGVRDR